MILLLDTHVLLWWYDNPDKISKEVYRLIENRRNNVYLSAVVIWEIMVKSELGKLNVPDGLIEKAKAEFIELPISISHTEVLPILEKIHSDPFDRILISQAIYENLLLATRDEKILQYKIATIKA